jgi:NAD(P)-dependent dehydrogenase (short-subunit alcohol dehydrogenase family)
MGAGPPYKYVANAFVVLRRWKPAGIEVMRRQKRPGHLINVSTLAARFDVGGVYGASKIALEMISRSLRLELENDDICVTIITF